MEIKDYDFCRIITPLCLMLDKYETKRVKEELSNIRKRVGIDMSYVKDCTIDFINELINIENISLFNISSDIFVLLINMNLDKKCQLYVSESDFIENKNQLLNRKLSLIKR